MQSSQASRTRCSDGGPSAPLRTIAGGTVALGLRSALLIIALSLGGVSTGNAQDPLRISGYGNAHYMDHSGVASLVGEPDPNDGFFQLREFSLFLDVAIADDVVASVELEAGENGTRYVANYAYLDVQATDNLSFRVGKILVPFLAYNENKANFRQNLMSQPFTAWNLAPVVGVPIESGGFGWSDAGAMVNWTNPVVGWALLDAKFAVINGLGSRSRALDGNTIRLSAGQGPVVRPRDGLLQNETVTSLRDNNGDKATVLKVTLAGTRWPGSLGVSWYRGRWDPDGAEGLGMLGAHLSLPWPNWSLESEFVAGHVEEDEGFDPVAAAGLAGPAAINRNTGDYDMRAWYVEGSIAALRWGADHVLKLVGRVDDVDTNDRVPFTPFDRSRTTVGMEWQFAPNVRLRYEWQRSVIDDFGNAPPPYIQAGGERVIQMHMPSVIFYF